MLHHYCPICGETQILQNNCYVCRCVACRKQVRLLDSLHEPSYYTDKSSELFGDVTHWREILIDEEVSKNPQFERELVGSKMSEEEHDKIIDSIIQNQAKMNMQAKNPNIPKCPTCQSENIKKISVAKRATHGALFGIFSKTAFSQFECNNCGYKW